MDRIGVVEVTGTELTTFGAVAWSFAAAENEGDESIGDWRRGHRRFWEAQGMQVREDMPVFLIYFRLAEVP